MCNIARGPIARQCWAFVMKLSLKVIERVHRDNRPIAMVKLKIPTESLASNTVARVLVFILSI